MYYRYIKKCVDILWRNESAGGFTGGTKRRRKADYLVKTMTIKPASLAWVMMNGANSSE
jgi:hypothetical protein